MPGSDSRSHAELSQGFKNLRSALLGMLAGFLLASALFTPADHGASGFSMPVDVGAPTDHAAPAEPVPAFDYFPSHYQNQATEIEPQPETF